MSPERRLLIQIQDVILLAWSLTTISQALIFTCLQEGLLGVHVWEMPLDDVTEEMRLTLTATLLVIPGAALAKLVLCILYYRLLNMPWCRSVIWATGFLTISASISLWLVLLLGCKPVEATWDPMLFTGGKCVDRYMAHMVQAGIGGVADVILVAVTLTQTLSLQLSWRKKAFVAAFFSNGLLTLGAAIARLVILVSGLTSTDRTFVLTQNTLCLIVESSLVIIYGSTPSFRIFVKHFLPRAFENPQRRMDRRTNSVQGSESRAHALHTIGGTSMDGRESDPGRSKYNNSAEVLVSQNER